MDYTADSLEGFLADFVTAADSPLIASGQLLLIYRTSYSMSAFCEHHFVFFLSGTIDALH